MDVLQKLYELASNGHSVGFRPSKLSGSHITLVIRKDNLLSQNDITRDAFISHQVMNAVLDDVAEAVANKKFHNRS